MVPQPVKAVIMLFPITEATEAAKDKEEQIIRSKGEQMLSGVWFTRQTVSNACGTVGVLHAMGNTDARFVPGSFLDHFFSISQSMTPEERAQLLENPGEGEPDLEQCHQDAARGGQSAAPADDDEVLSLPHCTSTSCNRLVPHVYGIMMLWVFFWNAFLCRSCSTLYVSFM